MCIRDRNLVAPLEMALERNEVLVDFVERGFGLVLIPRSESYDELREFYLEALLDQLENQLNTGQSITIVKSYAKYSEMYRKFLELLRVRGIKGLESA